MHHTSRSSSSTISSFFEEEEKKLFFYFGSSLSLSSIRLGRFFFLCCCCRCSNFKSHLECIVCTHDIFVLTKSLCKQQRAWWSLDVPRLYAQSFLHRSYHVLKERKPNFENRSSYTKSPCACVFFSLFFINFFLFSIVFCLVVGRIFFSFLCLPLLLLVVKSFFFP